MRTGRTAAMPRSTPPLSAINLNLLRVLGTVVSVRSVSRAASLLGVSQSAVSHALRELRELLDDPLIVRAGHAIVPTPFAERIGRRLHRGLEEFERALSEEAVFDAASSARSFTIAAEDHMAAIVLQSVVWHVRHYAPSVTFRVLSPGDSSVAALERGDVDLVIGTGLYDDALRQTTILTDRFGCLVRRDHPDVQGCITLAQLAQLPHAVLARPEAGLEDVERALVSAGVQRRVAVELPYFLLAPSLVPFSDLVLIAPRTLGMLFALGYPLQVLDPPLALPTIQEQMYWHARFDGHPANAWLRETVVKCVTEYFWRLHDGGNPPMVGSWPDVFRPLADHERENSAPARPAAARDPAD